MEQNIELNPLYNKVEYDLTSLEEDHDPLFPNQSNSSFDWSNLLDELNQLLKIDENNIQLLVWELRAKLHTEGYFALYYGLQKIHIIISDLTQKDIQSDEEKDQIGAYAGALSWLSTPLCVTELKQSSLYPAEKLTIKSVIDFDVKNPDDKLSLVNLTSSIIKANQYYIENQLPDLKIQLQKNIEYLEIISDYVNENSTGYSLDCHHLNETLTKLAFKINTISKDKDPLVEEKSLEESTPLLNTANVTDGSVNNRTDVVMALENILKYFQVHEPSHPAPILLKRIQKMIGMDFETIIEELLPESKDALQLYVGKKNGNLDSIDVN